MEMEGDSRRLENVHEFDCLASTTAWNSKCTTCRCVNMPVGLYKIQNANTSVSLVREWLLDFRRTLLEIGEVTSRETRHILYNSNQFISTRRIVPIDLRIHG